MGKKVPDPTPPKETSAAATGTNVSTAIANAMLGNISETGPDGSTKVTQTGENYTWTDPYTNEQYSVPLLHRDITLSPEQQAIKNEQDAAKLNLSTLAKDQSGFLGDYMSQPFKYGTGDHEKWSMGLYDDLNRDKEAQRMETMRSQLANSGVKLGSDAYGRAFESQEKATQDARNQFMLDSYKTGLSSAMAQRNQPINEITALMSGGQVSMPNFMGANMPTIPTTDNAGIIANYDQQRMAAAQANAGLFQNALGGLFSLGGMMISDRRTKKNVEKLGEIPVRGDDGKVKTTGLFAYDYKWEKKGDKPNHIGVMAQDLEKVKPSAVLTLGGGLKAVDYARV